MGTAGRLSTEDRNFLGRVAEVIFSNPFAAESLPRDAFGDLRRRRPEDHVFAALGPAVDERLRSLEERGLASLGSVVPEDRRLLEYGYLFQAYNRFAAGFDALIEAQRRRGDEPAEVPFVEDLLRLLRERGFCRPERERYVALFYQLRRAYFFIARSLVGDSTSMKRLRRELWNNVFTSDLLAYGDQLWNRMEDFSTLLLGETGTGKGTAAAAIGRSGLIPFDEGSQRFTHSFTGTFIATNLSQFPESLIESELFGHRKGAFTGAIDDHEGLFGRCSPHGALFLDEIGDLSEPIQLKLLNVIQERWFRPVGSRKRFRFEGRVIAATNRPLDELRRRGSFRDDFFYRLSSDVVEVPPLRVRLRENPNELRQLVRLLLERMTGRSSGRLAERVLDGLHESLPPDYPWPGNVRELEQALRRILIKGRYEGDRLPSPSDDAWLERAARGELTAGELLERYCRMLYERRGSYEAAARRLGLDRRTVKKHVEGGSRLAGSPGTDTV
jgi:DNA-binding NtrC family response regulator